jgi:hypothetical protein
MTHTPESTTHWACQKRLAEYGGESKCCACYPHEDCGDVGDNPTAATFNANFMTNQPQQKEIGSVFIGCLMLASTFILWVASFYTAPAQWRWFVLLTFTVFTSIKTISEANYDPHKPTR